jgi:hypothetical protein
VSKPFYVRWSELSLMVYMCRHVTPMSSDSHLRVHYAACQCVYVLLPIAILAFVNRSILQWSAMYGPGGNTTRVLRTDENLVNLFLCSGNYSRKIRWSIICGLIPTRGPPESRSAPHPHLSTSSTYVFFVEYTRTLLLHLSISAKASNETPSFST